MGSTANTLTLLPFQHHQTTTHASRHRFAPYSSQPPLALLNSRSCGFARLDLWKNHASFEIDLLKDNAVLDLWSSILSTGADSFPREMSRSTFPAAMLYERPYADVSAGSAGVPTMPSSSSVAWQQSTQDSYVKQKDPEDLASQKSKRKRTSTTVKDTGSDVSSDGRGRTRKKAEPVKSACARCQKRKTKCSGKRPVCRSCSDRALECFWDTDDGLTRNADLKRKIEEANRRFDDLNGLVDAMRSGSDQTSSMLLVKLRIGDSLEQLLLKIRLGVSPPESGKSRLNPQMVER